MRTESRLRSRGCWASFGRRAGSDRLQATRNSESGGWTRLGSRRSSGLNLAFRATPENSQMRVIRKSLRRLSCSTRPISMVVRPDGDTAARTLSAGNSSQEPRTAAVNRMIADDRGPLRLCRADLSGTGWFLHRVGLQVF